MSFVDDAFVWITPLYLYELFTDSHNTSVRCSEFILQKMLQGTFTIIPTPFNEVTNDKMVSTRIQRLKEKIPSNSSYFNYVGYAYDAVWTYVLALKEIETKEPWLLATFGPKIINKRIVEIIKNDLDFIGVTGRVKFNKDGSRNTSLTFLQWIEKGKYQEVGIFQQKIGLSLCNKNQNCIYWTQDGKINDDQPRCLFKIPCKYNYLIFLLVIVCIILISFPIFSFFFWKYKYETKYKLVRDEYNLANWEISPNDIEVIDVLGGGHFAKVHRGK